MNEKEKYDKNGAAYLKLAQSLEKAPSTPHYTRVLPLGVEPPTKPTGIYELFARALDDGFSDGDW